MLLIGHKRKAYSKREPAQNCTAPSVKHDSLWYFNTFTIYMQVIVWGLTPLTDYEHVHSLYMGPDPINKLWTRSQFVHGVRPQKNFFYPWIFASVSVHFTRKKKTLCGVQYRGIKIMNEKLQLIRMCMQTYINLYGKKPTVSELSQQLDSSYLQLIQMILSGNAAA